MIYALFGMIMVLAVAVAFLLFRTMVSGTPMTAGYSSSEDQKYHEAQKLLTEGKLEEAVSAFSEIENYMDSQRYIMYIRAIFLAEGGQYDEAARSFASLGEFRDSSLMVTYYNARGIEAAQRYEEAQEVYRDIITFRDSSDRLAAISDLVLERDYNKASALRDAGQYEEAVVLFGALDGYKDSAEQINGCKESMKELEYGAAVALMKEELYEVAIAKFEALVDYRDSKEQMKACKQALDEIEARRNNWHTVGSTVRFGRYEQDNNANNGPEEIEWKVLDVQDGRALLISKYALDCKQYNTKSTSITWENCTLRSWLNNEFLNTAFTAEERSKIPTVTVIAHKNPRYSTRPGKDTQDKVFLLSITEAEQYLNDNDAMIAAPTAYAIAQGALTNGDYRTTSGEVSCWWWLRSPGDHTNRAACVYYGGIRNIGVLVNGNRDAVRPALWVDLED